MSLAKTSILIIPQDSSPVKTPRADDISILHTQASSDDVASFYDNMSEKSISSPQKVIYTTEGVSRKLQLLARTGVSASRISLISGTCNTQASFAQSVSLPCEELRAEESLLLDKIPKQVIKTEVVQQPKAKVRDEFRDRYISNLKMRDILDSKSKKKHQSFMLIDWDGGLFGGVDIEEVKRNQKLVQGESVLKTLDETASKLLAKAAAHCPVFIITSYSEKDAEYSLRLYLPRTYRVFEKHNMEIISLQEEEDEKKNCTSESEPKVAKALMNLKKRFSGDIGTNIMCVVDSETKLDIIQRFTKKFEGALVKFMRFKDCVKVTQLIKQQELLIKEFENMFFSLRSFTMQFAKTQGKK